jgi:hypothetical protein
MYIYCRYCGAKNNESELYCRGCSAPFHDEYNQPKQEVLPELYNDYGITGTYSFIGMGNYMPSGSAIYIPHLHNSIRASVISPDEAREILELDTPKYETRVPTRIEDLPDIKLLDKIKNRLMDWRKE